MITVKNIDTKFVKGERYHVGKNEELGEYAYSVPCLVKDKIAVEWLLKNNFKPRKITRASMLSKGWYITTFEYKKIRE